MDQLDIKKDILLFYRKHQYDFLDANSNRTISGFYSWYQRLIKSLKIKGFNVIENNFDLARQNPNYPVGFVGTPIALKNWDLPNPVILGPSMYDHPRLNPNLMKDKRFDKYLFTCQWLLDIFKTFYGNKCALWYAGIEIGKWIDAKKFHKDIDVLIYNKLRWAKGIKQQFLLDPIKEDLENRKLNYYILNYGNISHEQYIDLLKRSRSMIFLCEHETQGMAYQEALSMNVPVLAWDPGYWVDPLWEIFSEKPVKSTSVPQFSDKCGLRFAKIFHYKDTFDKFWNDKDNYEPRKFVQNNLSLEKSAEIYYSYYLSSFNNRKK